VHSEEATRTVRSHGEARCQHSSSPDTETGRGCQAQPDAQWCRPPGQLQSSIAKVRYNQTLTLTLALILTLINLAIAG